MSSVLLNEINALCSEIRSEKVTTRNKAAERLDYILTHSKTDLIAIFRKRNQHTDNDLTWSDIFNASISGAIKHATKVEESQDSKSAQTLRNKNHIFNAILEKLIDYNLEENNNFLSKSTLLTAFFDGCSIRSSLRSFGALFIYILDAGIYKSPEMVCQLKVNEFSRILSYLFEINVANDENLRFVILRSVNKTIELAERYVQLNSDLVEYFPEIQVYAANASDDRRKSEVIKMFYLFISQLSVDYHSLVCINIQDLLPKMCGFYNFRMKVESKEIFFNAVCISLDTIYPVIKYEDKSCNSINVPLNENWSKTLKTIETIVEIELKERQSQLYRPFDNNNERCFNSFIKMSAKIVYLIHWHVQPTDNGSEENFEARKKIRKIDDKLETILGLVQPKNKAFNEIWLAILVELVKSYEPLLTISNYQQVLETVLNLMCTATNSSSVKHLRYMIASLLRGELQLRENKSISAEYCSETWSKLVECVIEDNSTNSLVINEKQLILQSFIEYKKLSLKNINELLHSYLSNKTMKRSECILTVRQILIHANSYGLEKTSELVNRVISWICETYGKMDAKSILLNIAPIDVDLLMDTSAIAVINFLNENQQFGDANKKRTISSDMNPLLYKYNRRIMCIDEHGTKFKKNINANSENKAEKTKNCLFQNNYALLMRLLNLETSKETTPSDISLDLSHLNSFTCLMRKFLQYGIFSAENFSQCPLIKRIGLFLSHLEFQLKSNDPQKVDGTDLLEILQRIERIFLTFTSNQILLNYLEAQPLDELVLFVGKTLRYSACQHMSYELNHHSSIIFLSLKVLALLCGSTSHFKDSFGQIVKYKFNIQSEFNILMDLIKIYCSHRHVYPEVAVWFVDKIKTMCQLYHTNVEISAKIVELLPDIFLYVQRESDSLDNMLIVLSSFLKKTYKKSYSIKFAINLMNSISEITKNCAQMCKKEDFTNICLSTAKFITSPALEIQFAAINTITALMDANWFGIAAARSNFHSELCEKLMSQIDLKSLPSNTTDDSLNSVSVTTQLLVGLFMFSSYHQETALQELAYFCALRKLNEYDFFKFNDIAAYFNCNLLDITSPYLFNLVHQWIQKQYPILKFPYFLCASTKDEFILQNIASITSCILIHSKVDQLKKLECYKSQTDLVEVSYSKFYAISLPMLSDCAGVDETKINHIKVMTKNLQLLGVSLQNNKMNAVRWEIIYNIMNLLIDNSHFESLFKFLPSFRGSTWIYINFETLLECLNYYLKRTIDKNTGPPILTLILKHSLILVQVFNALKKQTTNSYFAIEKLRYFHIYCTFSKLIIDSIETNASRANDQDTCKYFLRDILHYCLQTLQESQDFTETQCACITFVQQILETPLISVGFCNDVLKSNFNHIIKILMFSADNAQCSEIRAATTETIRTIIYNNRDKCSDAIAQLGEFPSNECFDKLREIHVSVSLEEEKDLQTIINSYLNVENSGTASLRLIRSSIAKNKSDLVSEKIPLCQFIKRLIDIVRNTKNAKFAVEAAKCLGEIGSLKIPGYSYYFATDNFFYDTEAASQDPMQFFVKNLLTIIEKMLLNYNKRTYPAICVIAEQLVNSVKGKSLLGYFPYLRAFRRNMASANCLDTYENIGSFDILSILKATAHLSYDDFIRRFVSELYKQIAWETFTELSFEDGSFAAASVIPIFKLLVANSERHLKNICSMLDFFFREAVNAISNEASNVKSIYKEKRLIKQFLNVCECIRIHNEWNLPINLLHVAKACNFCQAYFLSIMYLEMWALNGRSTQAENINSDVVSNDIFQEVAVKAYKSIGCCDAISGFLNPLNSRMEFLNLECSWSDVLLQADADASTLGSSTLYIDKLKRNGVMSLTNLSKCDRSIDYETSWRLCQWDTIVEGHSKINTLNDMEQEFEKHHFNALKCIYNREEINSLAAITNARNCVISILREISVECLQSVYKYLTFLHLLEQAEDFCQIQFTSQNEVDPIFEKWKTESDMQYGNFWCKEQTLSHQVTLFKTAGIRANRKIKDHFKDVNPIELWLLKCIADCKSAGEMNLAIRNIATLKNMPLSTEKTRVCVLLEDAELCFKTGKSLITKAILQHVLKNKDFAFCLERVKAYRMHGEYLMESNSETFETVLRTCFKGSMDLLKQFSKNKEQILARNPNLFDIESFDEFERTNQKHAYETIAKYADREYTQLHIYINSEEFQMKCNIIQQNRQAAESVGKQNKDRDKNIGAIFMKKFANLDEKEIQTVKQKCSDFLCIAVESYMQFCKIDQAIKSAAVYRIIALWFANKQNASLHLKISQNLCDIPSYKFLCALNQITARLNSKHKEFISLLKDILVRCVQDHPHHTLYQLFPLVFAFNDSTNNNKESNDRIAITKEIINKARNKSNSSCIKQLELMFPVLIDFANEVLKETNKSISDKLKRLNVDSVQCPTLELPVAVNKKYSIISVLKWEDKVSLVGGINAPKKLNCICSDGQKRPQLLKGKDDLRQDAVMQQVFSMINDLLKCEPETNNRKLSLRTYKVVPLSMRSGILEWCPNTIPIGVYLAGDGKNGAHKKYRPNDFTVHKCRQMSMQHLKADPEKRLQMYQTLCANIKPVFHYFFFEKFLAPGEWFERRLAYINSVATTSIVGFILGLGDRHTQNILIDEKTAEVVHIDFGIAFEQGKIMPTPETVPFRLTRDMIAPMGVCETNGVFKKSCEATMRILRRNQAVITTILEVLLYDPLYIWKVVTPAYDEEALGGKNLTAQRALLCVQNKLEGKQAGIFGTLDIEVQVQRLINDAILSQNLCMLYPGWDPYL